MSAANDRFSHLGPATEALFARVFADVVMIPANAACRLIGVDEKTFGALVEGGAVRYVLIGHTTKRYTEADLRAYLSRETELPCRSIKQRKAVSGSMTSSKKVVGFMDRRALRANAQPNR